MHFITKIRDEWHDWFDPRFEKFREWFWTQKGQAIFLIFQFIVMTLTILVIRSLTPKPEPQPEYELVRVVYPPPAPVTTTPKKIRVIHPTAEPKETPTHAYQRLD